MWNIPSVGQAEVQDYDEGQAVRYTAMDTGNFTFSITDYKASATYVTNKMKQDSFYMDRIISQFVPKQQRAIMAGIESAILALGPDAQTTADPNNINGAAHRLAGSGTNDTATLTDIAKVRYALRMASVPDKNLIGIVHPSVEVQLNALATGSLNYNPMWEGVISTGIGSGLQFRFNIFGFDIYTSTFLKENSASETISGNAVANGVNNVFFSAASDVLPFVGAIRQTPKVDSEYNKDLQRDEYVTTMRYGFKMFRPENFVALVTDKTALTA